MDLDANATTRPADEVIDAMMPWLRENFHNPSSSYRGGKIARRSVDQARGQVAELLGVSAEEIVFTGSGTESVNTALNSWDRICGAGDFLTTRVEHSAVLRTGEAMNRTISLCGVDASGALDWADYVDLLGRAAFVAVMAANNETGVLMDWRRAAVMAHEKGLPFFTDAIQAVGKMPVNLADTACDALALSAHKFHGPKGVGALYLRRGTRFEPLLHGGGQESGRRSGTENVAGIVGMGVAAALARKRLADGSLAGIAAMRDDFESRVLAGAGGVTRNGDASSRLANTSHLSFDGCEAAGLLILLDEMGVACSAGSACMAGKQQPSHVQKAMGFSDERAKSSLRFSFSHRNTPDEARQAADCTIRAVGKLRSVQGGAIGPVVVYSP